MKYYSELLNKVFDSATECLAAEEDVKNKESIKLAEQKRLEKEKAVAQARLTETYKKALEAANEFGKEVDAFIEKYGAVKLKSKADDIPVLFPFTNFFKL